MTSFGWGIIGTGAIANKVMREVTRTGRHHVVAAYSRTLSKAEKFAGKYGGKVTQSVEELLSQKGMDAVYIATPHASHYEYILECVKCGIPVLSEKSFTMNSGQSNAVINASDRHSYVSEAMWTRYNPITIKVKELVKSGAIGDIKEANASFSYPYYLSGFGSRVIDKKAGGGALLDTGVYPISYMEMLFGMPSDICATSNMNKHGVDMTDKIVMSYDSGIKCHIRCSIARLDLSMCKIVGTRGSITIPIFFKPTRAKLVIDGKKSILHSKAGYIHEFDAVAREIKEGKLESSYITLSSTHNVMTIMDKIREMIGLRYDEEIEKV